MDFSSTNTKAIADRRHRHRRDRGGPVRARARLRPLRAAPAAARPARRRAPPDDVQLRPARDHLHPRHRRRLERPLALRHHLAAREGAARLERRARALRRPRLQHPALEPRLGAARLVHAAAAARRPDHGRRRDGLRRGHGADLHDARHRRCPPDLHPEHAADDEHDREPHDQGSAPRRSRPASPSRSRRRSRRRARRCSARSRPSTGTHAETRPRDRRRDQRPHRLARGRDLRAARRGRRRRSRASSASTGSWRCASAGFSRAEARARGFSLSSQGDVATPGRG